MQQKAAKAEENCLRRRQSLPAVPAALLMPGRPGSKGNFLKSIDKLSGVAGSVIQELESFTTSKMDRHLFCQKVRQRISAMKTNTGVFVVFKTKRRPKCQFSGITEIL